MLHIISLIITPLLLLGITHLFSILFLQPSHYFPVWIWSEKLDANIPLILFLLIYPKSFALVDMRVSANSNLVFEQVFLKNSISFLNYYTGIMHLLLPYRDIVKKKWDKEKCKNSLDQLKCCKLYISEIVAIWKFWEPNSFSQSHEKVS